MKRLTVPPRRFVVLVLLCGVLALSFTAPSAPAAACNQTSTGARPLIALGTGFYQGHQGGLYPGGTNQRPLAHTSVGITFAKERAVPRAANGTPDAQSGKLGLLAIGMSNTEREFNAFISLAASDPSKSPSLVPVNGAQVGMDAGEAATLRRGYWDVVDQRVTSAGLTAQQVGVLWLKQTDARPTLSFHEHRTKLSAQLESIVRIAKERFPNLWLAYVSSRVYGGYASTDLSPEPWAYEEGFAVKALMEEQLSGRLPIAEDAAPWLSWGPYMWADGLTARSDGLLWKCGDFEEDGVHPSEDGKLKVANLLLDFVHEDPTARIWYRGLAGPLTR